VHLRGNHQRRSLHGRAKYQQLGVGFYQLRLWPRLAKTAEGFYLSTACFGSRSRNYLNFTACIMGARNLPRQAQSQDREKPRRVRSHEKKKRAWREYLGRIFQAPAPGRSQEKAQPRMRHFEAQSQPRKKSQLSPKSSQSLF
jgi:hypothetical protein